ncbi:uncharacterized protein PSFLO_03905 [Pseudozyma flocculosa]|uniref:Uncharacterized protein n=1 Tax=Pseudozyma flocculosa TaxID=84751 RepID=A0A5C3F411_9BASI|nr:uncharacterized protein PSFLO_03905 [Pseudozyma flocculosa]
MPRAGWAAAAVGLLFPRSRPTAITERPRSPPPSRSIDAVVADRGPDLDSTQISRGWRWAGRRRGDGGAYNAQQRAAWWTSDLAPRNPAAPPPPPPPPHDQARLVACMHALLPRLSQGRPGISDEQRVCLRCPSPYCSWQESGRKVRDRRGSGEEAALSRN